MLIGLTGGIACGKSTVTRALAQLGARVVDADLIARDVVAPGSPGMAQVIERFGPHLRTADGRLDRHALGLTIFDDAEARKALEAILHPLIAIESAQQIQAALAAKPPLVIYDAPLLFEVGRADMFRPVVVVATDRATQRARLMARDAIDGAAADARIDAQMPLEQKVARADHVIDNSGTREHTQAQVDRLWQQLTQQEIP